MAHMHYTGTGRMHSFRGLLADGEQDKIRIQGPTGEIAWRITKFQIITENPHEAGVKHVVKIWREEQSSFTYSIDFRNDELLAAASFSDIASARSGYGTIILDNALFVRNIFVTNNETSGSAKATNYYIELEEVKVSKAGMGQLAIAAARRVHPA